MSDAISANSFVYKVCYGMSSEQPKQVRKCTLFWRFLGMFLLGIPLVIISIALVVTFTTIIGFFFAHRFGFHKDEQIVVEYSHWPKIKGRRVWPIWLLVLPALYFLGLLAVTLWHKIARQVTAIQHTQIDSHELLFLIAMLLVCGLALGSVYYFHSETHRQLSQSFKIWWDNKVCPTIDVTDLPPEKPMTIEEETALG